MEWLCWERRYVCLLFVSEKNSRGKKNMMKWKWINSTPWLYALVTSHHVVFVEPKRDATYTDACACTHKPLLTYIAPSFLPASNTYWLPSYYTKSTFRARVCVCQKPEAIHWSGFWCGGCDCSFHRITDDSHFASDNHLFPCAFSLRMYWMLFSILHNFHSRLIRRRSREENLSLLDVSVGVFFSFLFFEWAKG